MNKVLLVFAILQCAALIFLYTMILDIREHAQALPAKIDMLVDASNDKPINLSCPECKDYTPELKDLKKESLRDNMTNLELVLNMLAETATTEISDKREPKDFDENKQVAQEGGTIAGNARKEIESKTGKKAISDYNFRKAQEKKLLK